MLNAIQRVVPILPVADITRSIDFYNLLGFTARRYQGSGGGGGYAFLSRDIFELHLTHTERIFDSPSGVYFYLAPGAAALLEAEFRSTGVTILSPLAQRPWKMNEFMLSDPDGNLLRFGEPTETL